MLKHSTRLLGAAGRQLFLSVLQGRLLGVCFGAGVDSTAMLVALRLVDIDKAQALIDENRDDNRGWEWRVVDFQTGRVVPVKGVADAIPT